MKSDSGTLQVIANAINWYDYLHQTLNMTLLIMQTMGDDSAGLRSATDIWGYSTGGGKPVDFQLWRAEGKPIWIYTTKGPDFPAPSIQTGNFGLQLRALGWQTFIYNYTHYMLWDVKDFTNEADGSAYQGWSGGSIMYPGVNGTIYLWSRMELLRDRFQDHDYLVLLQRTIAELNQINPTSPLIAQGNQLMQQIIGLMNGYMPTMNYLQFYALRNDIGTYLSENSILR